MQLPPHRVMASWPKPDYTDPPTWGHGVLIVNIICISLAVVTVLLRLYTRFRITYSAGFDDILIVMGLLFAIGMVIVTSLATENWGWNRHIWDIPPLWLSTVQKLNLVFQIMFSLSSSFTKLSLLWFCRRLLGAGKGSHVVLNAAFIGAMVFVALSCCLFTFITIFQCSPVKAYWQVSPEYPHTCMNDGAVVFSASVINLFTDFLVTTLPMPLIWSLKLPARQRLALVSIFGLGATVNVAGSVRTVYVWKSMMAGYDTTWLGWPVLVAAAVEINLGLICSSAPALRPLITAFFPHLIPSTRNIGYTYGQHSRSQKPWSTTAGGRSRPSRMGTTTQESRRRRDSECFQIMRTVEMESWSESRKILRPEITRAITPVESLETKDGGVVFSSAASGKSSASLPRDTVSPFADRSEE